jgi:hypothetical protein
VAPLAAVLVLVFVVGLARLAFTGTLHFSTGASPVTAASGPAAATAPTRCGPRSLACSCASFPTWALNAAGQPIPYGPDGGDLPIQVLGDRMAAQVDRLYQQAHAPVDIVAESEGTLGLYAMLARLDNLVGGISPYGSAGAQALIDSVSEVGASYFARASRDQGRPWLAVVPLADAVTLPACSWPQNMIFVNAFHGGLLGDAPVQQMIEAFLANGTLSSASPPEQQLRRAATLIAGAATAWRMPDLHPACQG